MAIILALDAVIIIHAMKKQWQFAFMDQDNDTQKCSIRNYDCLSCPFSRFFTGK
jgi:hypothetical protein